MSYSYMQVYDPTGLVCIAHEIKNYHHLERSRQEMNVGRMQATLPLEYRDLFIRGDSLREDTQVRIFRGVDGQTATLDLGTFWFVDTAEEVQDSDGKEYLSIRGVDSIGMLDRRIIPYAPTDSQSDKTGYAGDLLKAFVRENFGALATDTTRDLSAYLTVAADSGDGALIDVAVQHPKFLEALQETANTSAKQGTYISFDVLCDPVTGKMEFRTFPICRGADRRKATGNQLFVGRNRGNITNCKVSFSTAEEINYAYVFGGTVGDVQIYSERQDSTRIAVSPFNRREAIVSCGNEIDPDILDSQGDQYIRGYRPRWTMVGDLVETYDFVYGLHVNYGDYLTLDDRNRSFDIRLSAIDITEDGGVETVKVALVGDQI